MENNEKIDPTVSRLEIRHFVFVKSGEYISDALHVVFSYDPDDSDSLEKNLKFLRRNFKEIPEGNLAVLVYDRVKDRYYYYKNITHRRKSFALSCDSE